jgi:hypothetical protein
MKFLLTPNKTVLSKLPQKRMAQNQHNLRIGILGKSVVAFCGTLLLVNLKQN